MAKTRKQSKKTKYFFTVIIIAAALFLLLLVCPLFNIKTVEITGIDAVSESEIKERLKLDSSVNLLAFNRISAKNTLLENPYISDVSFSKELPDKLIINIKERKVRGYVPYMGTFLYIDDDGRVLEASHSYTKKLPVVKGLNFNTFTVGEILEVDNETAFDTVVELSRLMVQYDILNDVINVDVSKTDNIKIITENVTIYFGDFSEANQKISTLNEILKKIPEDSKGFLDMSDPNANPRFTMLT